MQTVCASGSNFLPQCVEGTSKVLIIRCSQGFVLFVFFLFFFCFFWGGGEILNEINGQNHQTSMARISASICSIWSRSLRSSECIGKQYSIANVHGINNTSSTIIKIQKMSFRADRASAHSAGEPCIWRTMPPKVIYKPN